MPYKDPRKKIAYNAKRRGELRAKIKEFKEALCCIICGESDPACIDFHHKDPSQKDFDLANAARRGYSWKRILEEIAKCEVLCANCHRKHHAKLLTAGVAQ